MQLIKRIRYLTTLVNYIGSFIRNFAAECGIEDLVQSLTQVKLWKSLCKQYPFELQAVRLLQPEIPTRQIVFDLLGSKPIGDH
jgi:hypothetical protein